MTTATHGAPYTVPPEPNRLPAIALAVAVHAALLAFLWFGISWQNDEPVAVEAEVWDMKVQSAAAPALPPPAPPKVEEPKPEPKPEPAPPKPKAVEPEPVKPAAPDIKLEREKKLAEQKKEREREQQLEKERERKEQELAEKKKEEADKKLAQKKELEKKELEKKELEKKELAKKAEADKKLAAEKADADKKKLAAEKAAKAKADAAEQAKLDKIRADELKRISGAAGSSGDAQKSSAPKIDSGYQSAIAGKVKSNTNYSGDTNVPGNPAVEFRIEQLPTGEILSVKKTKSSGISEFDDAVEKGIMKSSPLPKKKDGTVERSFPLKFKLKDME